MTWRALAAFRAQQRDEVDHDTLSSNLVAVVAETLQPSQVVLGLRDGGRSRREQQVEERRSPALS